MNATRSRPRRIGRLATVILLTTACRGGGVEQISSFPEETGSLPPRLTVVSWNAQKGRQAQFRRDLAALIDEVRPDLLFLQEGHHGLVDSDRLGGHFAKSWSYPWPGGRSIGVMTMSRRRPIEVRAIPTFWRELLFTAPKVSLTTRYPLPHGKTLLVVNVHCLNFERWSTLRLRSQLRGLAAVMQEHEGPIIVGGDFNTWNAKRLRQVEQMARELSLAEVTGFPARRKTGGKNPFLNWLLGIDEELPLDRFYVRGVAVEAVEVLPYRSSDHPALRVTLRLDSPRSGPRDENDQPGDGMSSRQRSKRS